MSSNNVQILAMARAHRMASPFSKYRGIILAACLGWMVQSIFKPYLLPYGPADVPMNLPQYIIPSVNVSNDLLRSKHGNLQKIYERVPPGQSPLLQGAETIFFDSNNVMYVTTQDAKLLTLTDFETLKDGITIMATVTEVADLGVGRPLAGVFHPIDGSLYITDLHLGLLRLKRSSNNNNNNGRDGNGSGFGKVELIASRVRLDDDQQWSPLQYVNDVAIGPKTGNVYFTDSTDIVPDRFSTNGHWDGMYPAKLDLMRGKRAGRLLMYNPQNDQLSILATNLSFANGVAVVMNDRKEETHLLVAETVGPAIQRFDLTTRQLFPIDGLPGYPDGVDCCHQPSSTSGRSGPTCYAALPSTVIPLHRLLLSLPHGISSILRTLLMTLPKRLAPPVEHYGGIAEINPSTGKVERIIQDPTATDIGLITGVTCKDQKLYLGSLENDFIGIYHLK